MPKKGNKIELEKKAKINFTSGCPNNCEYCYETDVLKIYDPVIPNNKFIQILDMNMLGVYIKKLGRKELYKKLNSLPKKKWEFVCGVDYRFMDQEIAFIMKKKGFIKIRWAWDYQFSLQKKQKKVYEYFIKAGYKPKDLSVFMLVNWKIPYLECCMKLDLLKVWNVKVNDCCHDGGYKRAKPKYWTIDQIKKFRALCRKHNQMVLFGIDPEYKGKLLWR